MKRREAIRHLREHGCELEREGGRHTIILNPKNGKRSSLPRHEETSAITMGEICKALEIAKPRGR